MMIAWNIVNFVLRAFALFIWLAFFGRVFLVNELGYYPIEGPTINFEGNCKVSDKACVLLYEYHSKEYKEDQEIPINFEVLKQINPLLKSLINMNLCYWSEDFPGVISATLADHTIKIGKEDRCMLAVFGGVPLFSPGAFAVQNVEVTNFEENSFKSFNESLSHSLTETGSLEAVEGQPYQIQFEYRITWLSWVIFYAVILATFGGLIGGLKEIKRFLTFWL